MGREMKSKLVTLENFSGSKATIYSILEQGHGNEAFMHFDRFINNHKKDNLAEVLDIHRRLKSIGNITGCNINFFKQDEGLNADDLVCALYDVPKKHLRLYCIRLSDKIVIIGGGGPKNTRTWQQDALLTKEVHSMMHISGIIRAKLKTGDLCISSLGLKLEGDLHLSRV
ncbi:hypothetical protein SAMN05518672_10276 [Chitinophaga sp. CF118]|uniref:hypothetical protein n=1 Tax=Chitinophaga sp. CF118 TaxID=1884367 RepID=UPI0008F2EF50|nr:hypothetical protein [Chitinophaga sp. CF118]SFD47062.1 hypothetical protein SAMN05518672_10276 [Chitinophaga sp. CF118]